MNLMDAVGLTALVYEPYAKGRTYIDPITHKVGAYQQETLAVGGFWSAQIGLNVRSLDASEWFTRGLGRQIDVHGQGSALAFRGFVNRIVLSLGAQSISRGPLMDVGNRVSAVYSPKDFSVSPPVTGSQTVTTISEDLTSQGEYGVIEKVVNAGATTLTNANKARDVFLLESARPRTSGDLALQPDQSQPLNLTLELLGNVHWLKAYIYNNYSSVIGLLSTKLAAILDADPNAIFSSAAASLEANAYALPLLEDQNRFAWDILMELLALGNDVDDSRRLLGVYEDDQVVYAKAPTEVEYNFRVSDQKQAVFDVGGGLVLPWAVRPGKWLAVPDFLTGNVPIGTPLEEGPRNRFLESVKYIAPWTLNLSGGRTDRLAQMLAKITYSGGFL